MYQYFSNEIIWGARFTQRVLLKRKRNVNIGSFAQSDIDKVVMERNFPRESAQALARMEEQGTDDDRSEASV